MTVPEAQGFLAELARWSETSRWTWFDQIDARQLLVVSLLPEWDADLADRLGLASGVELTGLLAVLDQAGLVERRAQPGPAGSRELFWIRSRRRGDIGDYLRQNLGPDAMVDGYLELCQRADSQLSTVDLTVWRQVQECQLDVSGKTLMDWIEELIERDDLPTATSAVASARVVGDVLGEPYIDVVARAQWRLEREYRTRNDIALLRNYHRRPVIERAVVDLIEGRDDAWALHLRGNAGVGKTMTIRYLASGLFARDYGLPRFPVARVDFDHLDPRYPEQRPAELLVALTDELLGFAVDRRAERSHRAVYDSATGLAEELSRVDSSAPRSGQLLDEAVNRFGSLVRSLSAPVLLVLDTCEELAKLHLPNTTAPAIDQTFELLTRLRAVAPDIRVLLAGRRWLVEPGAGQPGAADAGEPRYAGPVLRQRPYVQVHRMLGFTRDEADGYLGNRKIPQHLWPVLLRESADEPDRHNPFELASYCDWVLDDPNVTEAELGNANGDAYVERRILARLNDNQVSGALPAAVAFGRFDRTLIEPALTRAGLDPDAAFAGLAAQEWVNVVSLGEDGRPRVIEVDPHLRDRLRAVLARAAGQPLVNERELGQDAAEVLASAPLASVTAETVEAMVRLLPPDQAAQAWDQLDQRLLEDGEWAWAMQITPRSAAVETERAGPTGPTILAAILATQASARIHTGQQQGLTNLWLAVSQAAARHPVPDKYGPLTRRARLGAQAAGVPLPVVGDWFADSVERPDALLAALETAVNDWFGNRAGLDDLVGPLVELATNRSRWIAAGAMVLLAGLRLGEATTVPAPEKPREVLAALRELLDEAIEQLVNRPLSSGPRRWPDWVAPAGLLNRLRLMRMLIALYGGDPVHELVYQRWLTYALVNIADIDADRLAAAILDYKLCFGPLEPIAITKPVQLEGRLVPWLHHRLARPMFIALADALSTDNQPDQAAELINEHRQFAVLRGDDAQTVVDCDLALLRLCRQFGTQRYASVQRLAYDESRPRIRDEAWFVLRQQNPDQPGWQDQCTEYGRWRCTPTLDPQPDANQWVVDHVDIWESQALSGSAWIAHPTYADGAIVRVLMLTRQARRLRGESFTDEAPELLGNANDDDAGFLGTGQPGLHVGARPEGIVRRMWTATTAAVSKRWWRLTEQSWSSLLLRGVVGLAVVAGVLLATLNQRSQFASLYLVLVGVAIALFLVLDAADSRFFARRVVVRGTDETLIVSRYRFGNGADLDDIKLTRPADREWVVPLDRPGALDRLLPRPILPPGRVMMALQLDRERQLEPWELRLSQQFPTGRRAKVVWVRLIPGGRRRFFRDEWLRAGATFRGPKHLRPSSADSPSTGPWRVYHLVGEPVNTTAGVQLRVRDDVGQSTESARTRSYEQLLDLDRLLDAPAVLMVLQAELIDGKPQQFDDEQRIGFQRCALAMLDQGVHVVLVVPPVDDQLAHRLIGEIWTVVKSTNPPSALVLLSLVVRLKNMVYTASRPISGDEQPDLDILLYYRPVNGIGGEVDQ